MHMNKSFAADAAIDPAKIAGGGGTVAVYGDTFWVDNTLGNDSNAGTKTAPLKTLKKAISMCQNTHDDVVVCVPGHTETLSGNPALTIDKSSVTVIGLGRYSKMPTFTLGSTVTHHVLVTGAGARLSNLKFLSGAIEQQKLLGIQADGAVVEDCYFGNSSTAYPTIHCISIGTANNDSDGAIIRNNVFYLPTESTNAPKGAIYVHKDQVGLQITDNFIQGAFDAPEGENGAPIYALSTEHCTNVLIADNLIDVDTNDNVCMIDFQGTNTGMVARNLTGDLDADGTPILATGCGLALNYHTSTVTKSGALYPAADS